MNATELCHEVKLLSGFAPSIHLGIGDGPVDLIVKLGGTPDISVYEDATAIEGATLTLEGVELRAQRPHRQATPEEVELLRQARRPTLRIFPTGKPNEG